MGVLAAVDSASSLISGMISGRDLQERCDADAPWLVSAWKAAEAILAKRPAIAVDEVPTILIPKGIADWKQKESFACREIIQRFGGWGDQPFLVRGLFDEDETEDTKGPAAWSLEWLQMHVPETW